MCRASSVPLFTLVKLNHFFKKEYRFPKTDFLENALHTFSPAEKVLSFVFTVLLIVGAASLVYKVNALFLIEQPAFGGEFKEGVIGNPRFINPLLSLSDADRDLSALVYSGLMKATPEGTLIEDLAEHFNISEDGLSYTFKIRDNAKFHDGMPVTAEDVIFTIQKAQDSSLKSPKRANWEGVTVEKNGERELTLTLNQAYAPFLENATLGILPKHVWKDVDSESFPFSPRNLEAVGSGPYKVDRILRSDVGVPFYFEFSAFEDYMLSAPHIKKIAMRFYPSETALLEGYVRGEIESMNTIAPEAAKKLEANGARVERTPLPRVFAVFFNQNQAPIFAEKGVRQALSLATDKELLVETVLHSYGVPIHGPVPPLLFNEEAKAATSSAARMEEANLILDKGKWVRNAKDGVRERSKGKETERLSFSLVTSDVPELKESAELLKEMWERIGVEVRLQIFESGDLNQNVIRPRKFDALLFGEIIGRDLDLFAFWHSSQRNDPGLNIAMYTNSKVDKLLEEARRTTDAEKRRSDYEAVVETIKGDLPALFLYSPELIYVLPNCIKGFNWGRVTVPSERFLDVHRWYTRTEKVWSIFTN